MLQNLICYFFIYFFGRENNLPVRILNLKAIYLKTTYYNFSQKIEFLHINVFYSPDY